MNCRKRYRVVRVAVVLVVMTILTVAFLPQLALAISQRWYLTNTTTATEYVMQRGSTGSAGLITVLASSTEIWVAHEAASLPVTFPSGNWTGQITATPDSNTHVVTVEIGSWNGSTFTSAGTSGTMSFPTKGTTSTLSFTITGASAINIPQGNFLALMFDNTAEGKFIAVEAGANSYLNSPSTDPGYPSPWDSYLGDYSTSCEDYNSGTSNTIYMNGTGFAAGDYTVRYWDATTPTPVQVGSDVNITVPMGGEPTDVLKSSLVCNTDPNAVAGTWSAKVYGSGEILIADDTFYVNANVIPEFPTIFAAIGVAGLCFGIYWWMKRRLVYVKA